MELGDKQKRKLMAAAEIVDQGDMAVLQKILEFMDYFDEWKEEMAKIREDAQGFMPQEIQNKVEELSIACNEKVEEMSAFKEAMEEKMNNGAQIHSEAMQKMYKEMETMKKSLSKMIESVRQEIPEMPAETDLTDIYNRLKDIEGKIPQIPDEITPYQVRDKLESIDNESEKLQIEAIKGLREELDELKKKSGGRAIFGGGFNYSAMSLHIVDDETPSGAINGSNTVFTLANVPSPASSLKVYLNGARQRITEDYTLSGGTITFTIAPPTGSILLADYRN